jgi:uncharacterized membrane protein
VMVSVLDFACCVWVDCCLFSKYDLRNATVLSVKLNWCRNLCRSLLCSLVSYALDRSIYMASIAAFAVLCLSILLIVCSAMTVLECGRNAYCVGDSMSCSSSRCFMIWLLIRVSNTLAMIGRSDMGL